jgi:hypothetical protein
MAHVVARAGADDPHTLAVLALAEAMPDHGTVFSAESRARVDGVKPLDRIPARDRALLVYHQRGAAPALVARLVARAAPLAVVHDDGSPGPLAMRDLRVLGAAGALGIATSSGGERRLVDLGFSRVARVPPVVARRRLAAIEAFPPTTHHLDVALHGPLVASVTEIAGASSAARVVQAYHVLRTYLVRAAHLVVAVPQSPETDERTLLAVHREIWGLRLTDAWLQRLAHPGERAALTRGAAVFVTADPASGAVATALAAMAEGVAVVAPADVDAAEVLGAGALLLPPAAGPALIAEAVAELLENDARRARFSVAAGEVVDRYDPARVAPAWHAALAA